MISVAKKKKQKTKKKSKQKTTVKKNLKPSDTLATKANSVKPEKNVTSPTVVPMPTAGRKVTEFEEKLDDSLAGGNGEKRKRGRPKKAEQPPVPELDIAVIGQAIQIPFDIWAVSQDVPDLKISIAESVMIAKPLKQILDHYMPNVPDITWAWISLSAVSYTIVKSRLALIAEIKKARETSSMTGSDNAKPTAARATVKQGQGGPGPSGFPNMADIKKGGE